MEKAFDVVIYHSPCQDGRAAAYVAWKYATMHGLTLPDFHPMTHTDEINWDAINGARVLMVDITFSRKIMERIHDETLLFVVLDHHKTAQDALEGFSNATFDMDRSGVMLAWDYFFPGEIIPSFLEYIGLRDLWRHKENERALYFTAAFEADFDSFRSWDLFYEFPVLVDSHCEKGEMIIREHNKRVEKLAERAWEGMWNDTKVKVYEIKVPDDFRYISDLGNFLTLGDPELVAFMWYAVKGGYKVSLRSTGYDVGTLALNMNGGGHTLAAGFVTETHPREMINYTKIINYTQI